MPPHAIETAFDSPTLVEMGRRGLFDRIGFAAVYAALSLFVLPWTAVASWIAAIVLWELIISPPIDRAVTRWPLQRASIVFAIEGVVVSSLYQTLALLCLAKGSALGAVLASTWICGAVLNIFVYCSATRLFLLSNLVPVAMVSVVGPWLAYGAGWKAAIIPAAFALVSLATRRFSLDHGALLDQLADRQMAFTEIERKLQLAVEASGDGLFEANIGADELHVDANWLAMLGYAPDEVASPIRDWEAFVHPDDRTLLREDFATHFRGETPHTSCELRMLCKGGEYKWVLARARLVSRTQEGEPLGLVGTTIDLSARKALEQQLEATLNLAEKANHAKSVFVANMSHEIRTPLNGVIGITGALSATQLSASQREMVSLIQSSGQMLDRMLSDILDQAKIEAGNFELRIATFDLRSEIEASAALMRGRADEKGLRFRVLYSEAARGVFEGDAVRLRQIVTNLASNAIKFTAAGDVTITVETRDPDTRDGPTLVRIEVADTGIGFDADTAGRLFSRFVQADESIAREFGGTGLGLAICRALTNLMGGQISARSQPGVGSVFTVEAPMQRSGWSADDAPGWSVEPIEKSEAAGFADVAPPHGQIRILLAEDHPTNQRVVQLILEPMGFSVTVVGDGKQAVDICQTDQFDLILMDMQMPVMDGLEATRAIRSRERAARVAPTPIAMFSANAMDEHLALAAKAGADHHISKPITPERLLAGIERALNLGASGKVAAVA